MEEIQVYETIDYTQNFETLEQELINMRELQVMQINNTVEFISISFVFVGLIIACMIGLSFIKVAFKS